MTTDRHTPRLELPASGIPTRLRLLCVAAEEPGWVRLTLNLDRVDCQEPQFRWVDSAADALSLLRNESFDCIVLGTLPGESAAGAAEGTPGNVQLLEALATAGYDDPLVLVVPEASDLLWTRACRFNAELFASRDPWNSPALVSIIHRALARAETGREKHRLAMAQQRRENRERDEAHLLLDHLHQILDAAPNSSPHPAEVLAAIPTDVVDGYRQLLRTYVIMGTGNLGPDIAELAGQLAEVEASPRDALAVHVQCVESLVTGLGNRSTRHIMARADLMALELVLHLGDCYQNVRPATKPS